MVVAATILAVNDPAASLIPAGTIPATGGVTTTSVTANDNTNGTPIVLGTNASMTVGTFTAPTLGAITLSPTTGLITVAAGTTPGSYTVPYTICTIPATTPTATCSTANAIVVVAATILAVNDTPPAIPATGGSTPSVVANDTTNGGVPVVLGTNATLTPGTIVSPPAAGSIVMNPATGVITVATGTTPGTYSYPYTICTLPATVPPTCSTATATVVVGSVIIPVTEIGSAVAGTAKPDAIVNIRSNDTVNGLPATPLNSDVSIDTTSPALPVGMALNPATGAISTTTATPPGVYTIIYKLCDKVGPNCATMVDTVTVGADILPVTDSGSAFAGNPSTPIANVAANDKVNGVQASLGASGNATVAQVGTWPTGITLDPVTGAIKNDATVVAGVYDIVYKLCDKNTPVNCKDMTDRITVSTTPLVATNDVFAGANGTTGNANIGNALDNDSVNGAAATVGTAGNSVLTVLEPATPNTAGAPVPSVDPLTGIVSVPPGTSGGTYVIKYKLCEKLNPTNCKEATITVPIAAIDTVKAVGVPKQVGPKVFEVSYSIVVAKVCASAPTGCSGTPTSFNVQVNDNLKPTFPTATSITVSNYAVVSGANGATCTAAATSFQGNASASALFSGVNDLSAGQSCVATFKVTVDFGAGAIPATSQNNLAYASAVASDTAVNAGYTYTASGAPIPPANAVATDISTTAPPTSGAPGTLPARPLPPTTVGGDSSSGTPTGVIFVLEDDGQLSIRKSTVTKIATAGDVIEYAVIVSNSGSNPVATKVTDTPPTGFVYVAGTVKLNGAGSGAPIQNGTELIFDIGNVPAKSSVELRYQMKLGDDVVGGEASNCVGANGVNTLTGTDKESGKSCASVIVQTGLFLEKRANVTNAELGDSVEYSLRVKSVGGRTNNVTISDNLPLGFKLIEGTVRVIRTSGMSVMANPAGSPGPALNFDIGSVANKEVVEIRYRVRLGIGSDLGDGINRAQAKAPFATSSLVAAAKVLVTRGVFTREACVAGKVYVDCNQNGGVDKGERNSMQDKGEPGIPGVRLYMEDGTNITTDENGQYSICGIRAITHVMQVDMTTMPAGSVMGITSNRNLGDGVSLMMNIKAGELYRADFNESSCTPAIMKEVEQRRLKGVTSTIPVSDGLKAPPVVQVFDSKVQELTQPPICETNPTASVCTTAGGAK